MKQTYDELARVAQDLSGQVTSLRNQVHTLEMTMQALRNESGDYQRKVATLEEKLALAIAGVKHAKDADTLKKIESVT